MKKITKVASELLRFDLINEEAIIVPCKDSMEEIRDINDIYLENKKMYSAVHNKEMKKRYTPMKDGDIRIIEVIKDVDLIYVKFPYKCDETSYDKFIEVYKKLIKLVAINEYKKVLLPYWTFPGSYGFSNDEMLNIYGEVTKEIKKIEGNIFDMVI